MTAPDATPGPVPLVLLCGGPLDGQAFTATDFAVRWHATDRIERQGGQRGPALDYRTPGPGDWHLIPRELPLVKRGGAWVPLDKADGGYAVTPLVWGGGPVAPPSWALAATAEHEQHGDGGEDVAP